MADKRPRPIQGYRIQEIYHDVRVKSLARPGDTYVRQKPMGLGVNGPNVSEHDPHKLIKLGMFLQEAGFFLLSLRYDKKEIKAFRRKINERKETKAKNSRSRSKITET